MIPLVIFSRVLPDLSCGFLFRRSRLFPARSLAAALAVAALMFAAMPLRSASAETLVVYSGRGERFTRPVLRAFRAVSGIKTQALVGKSGQLLARIREEGARTPADVFITNYAGTLEQARKGGLLQSYRSPMLARIPAEFIGPDAAWVGASARARAVVYNTDLHSKPPIASIFELAQPQWRGRLGVTVSSNGSFIGGLAAMLEGNDERKVEAFLEGIKANAGNNVFPKHTPIVSAVARGEISLGLINHYYYYRAISKNPAASLGIIFPDQGGAGAPTTLSGLAILKHAKHVRLARRFVDFVLSPRGQKLYAEVNFEFPVSRDVPAHPLLPPRESIRLAPVAQGMNLERIDRAVRLIKSVGLR